MPGWAPRRAAHRRHRRAPRRAGRILLVTGLLAAGGAAFALSSSGHSAALGRSKAHRGGDGAAPVRTAAHRRTARVPTTSTLPATTAPRTATTTTQASTTAAPGGFVPGRVSAIGDSVLIDYAGALEAAVPGTVIDASVGRQWQAGIASVEQLRAAGELGSRVVIDLGTNGPISSAQFEEMMRALSGAARVVFVTVHVAGSWQDEVNAVLEAGVATHPGAAIANWNALASAHRSWLYPDGTHMPIDGTGAEALASLIAHALATS